MWTAMAGESTRRGDEQHRGALRYARKDPAQDRGDAAEGRGHVAWGCGRDLVQGPAAQAALRQMCIESRKIEGERARGGRDVPREQAAQLMHDFGAGVV